MEQKKKRKKWKIVVLVLVLFIILSAGLLGYKLLEVGSAKEYLSKKGEYTMDVYMKDEGKDKIQNYQIKGVKSDNIYGKIFYTGEDVPFTEFYMGDDNVLFNIKTVYDYALNKIHLENNAVLDKLLSDDMFISKEQFQELAGEDTATKTDLDDQGELVKAFLRLHRIKKPETSEILNNDDGEFKFYKTKYKESELTLGIEKDGKGDVWQLYFSGEMDDKMVELKYSIYEEEEQSISMPQEKEFSYLEKAILKKIISMLMK